MSVIKVDFSASSNGKIRALHGVNSGPMTKVFTYDARPLFIEAGLPYARLHDVEYPYGSGEFVDIPCIFRDFDADIAQHLDMIEAGYLSSAEKLNAIECAHNDIIEKAYVVPMCTDSAEYVHKSFFTNVEINPFGDIVNLKHAKVK